MDTRREAHGAAGRGWMTYALALLLVEKTVQHTVVTLAFAFNWGGIRSTVVVSPDALMVLGALVAPLFLVALWGLLARRRWAIPLVLALAAFDLVGELVAQGTLAIQITVSFVVALALLVLGLLYGRRARALGAA